MLAAALASHDGPRVKKAIAYFMRASSMRDSSGEFKKIITNNWKHEYSFALLTDARLNKAEGSAKAAASIYLKEYEEALKNRVVANYRLQKHAEVAASAFSELYSITHSQDDANSAICLACESLLRLRYSRKDREEAEERDAPLARRGLQQGFVPEAPPPEQTEAYKIIVRSGKDPSTIFAPGPEMKMKDCETF